MPLSNPSFEDEDPAAAGFAQFWTVTEIGSDGDAALYGTDTGLYFPSGPTETFRGGWNGNELDLFAYADPPDIAELEASIYDAESLEDFEEGWDNVPFFLTMGATSSASYDGNVSLDSAPGPWVVTAGQKLDLTTDDGSGTSDGVAYTAAYLQAANVSSGPPIGFDPAGETVRIYFNNRAFIVVTFTPAQVDVAGCASAINTAKTLQGYPLELAAGTINPGSGFRLFIQSSIGGYGSEIRVENVSHPDTWQRIGMSATQIQNGAQGTGNVFLQDEALPEDIAAIVANSAGIQAINSGAVALPDGRVRVWSDPGGTITVDSTGPLGGVLGFLLDTPTGPTGFTAEAVEDFEEGYDNLIFPDEGNILPGPFSETWTALNVTTTATPGQADPYGLTQAWELRDITAAGGGRFSHDSTGISGDAMRARIWIEKDPTAPQFCEFLIDFNGFANVLLYVDQANGRAKVQIGTALTEAMLIEAIPGWWRLDMAIPAGQTGPVHFEMRSSRGPVSAFPVIGPIGVADTAIRVYGARLVQTGFPVLTAFALSWMDVDNAAATFDGGAQTVEDFTGGWLNDSFQFTMGATSSASWDAGAGGTPEAVEDFEETIAPFVAVPDQATDTLTKNAHGLSNGQIVTLTAEGGVLPTGLATGTNYFVIAAAANTFQLSLVSGGAAVNFTDNGSGSLRVTPPATVFWINLMTTL